MQETGPTVYRPYPRRLKVSPNSDVIAKEALSPQLIFKTLSVGPARARTLDLPARQSSTHPTELTRQRLVDSGHHGHLSPINSRQKSRACRSTNVKMKAEGVGWGGVGWLG